MDVVRKTIAKEGMARVSFGFVFGREVLIKGRVADEKI
jgi:hypothetical protein